MTVRTIVHVYTHYTADDWRISGEKGFDQRPLHLLIVAYHQPTENSR